MPSTPTLRSAIQFGDSKTPRTTATLRTRSVWQWHSRTGILEAVDCAGRSASAIGAKAKRLSAHLDPGWSDGWMDRRQCAPVWARERCAR